MRKYDPDKDYDLTPLYTAEQLHPRVKMTQKQRDRLMWDKENTDLSTCLGYFLEHDGVNNFGLPSENLMGLLTQEDIARAWLNPEETIEIVPDMKWFVRSKDSSTDGCFVWLDDVSDHFAPTYTLLEKPLISSAFDTKEEAEKWTNPLTEAVQLPVEEE
ncbi:hypothetical protein [Leuconostoc falkenbergense]|uniref:hypothetical protein n=1 Tax=Leuconostoc falkenbergense TaxID=2766470 RepID=UPI00293C18F9|nr:hypothetical protein [Leuconostoc falkenbergense]MDV3544892.1 hypothetical protein [Leuconostoc falkenbergense]